MCSNRRRIPLLAGVPGPMSLPRCEQDAGWANIRFLTSLLPADGHIINVTS
jgi:hypothetical protein